MNKEENYYEARLDRIFGKGNMWKHRTFRTVFDPYSSEWSHTDIDKKLEILETIIEKGENLEILIEDYKERYNEQNRRDIANEVDAALAKLLTHSLTRKK